MKVLNYTGLQNLWTNIRNYITAHTPTKTSDLTNDSNFVDTSNPAVASGITSAKVTSYDAHIADTGIHVTTADKNKWNNQTYVFRYSSTALVASSTNSNTLLDNTDNLKVGDKVIDSNGVLFSITAIDTANSTFTIGTALVDLAQDSDVVHKSGNEYITDTKTFGKGTLIVDNSIGSNVHGEIKFNGSRPGYIVADNASDGVFDNTESGISILLQDAGKPLHVGGYKVDSNGRVFADNTNKNPVLTVMGSLVKTSILIPEGDTANNAFRILSQINYANGDTSKVLDVRFQQYDNVNATSAIYSYADNKTSLGATTKRWSGVYSTSYYYGNDNVEFSTKFVTTDTNQTISGSKTFSDLQIIGYGTQYKGARNAYILPEFAAGYSGLSITTMGFAQALKIGNFVLDANNKPSLDTSKAYIQISTGESNGVNACLLESRNSTSSSLGTSANKWSEIHGTEYYYGSNNVEFSTKFVTTDTNQTITGVKTFSNDTYITSLNSTNEVASPSSSSSSVMPIINTITYTSGDTSVVARLNFRVTASGDKSLYPHENNQYFLGLTSRKWKEIHATTYYYGSSDTEFSNKFVTSDSAQTITERKTFTKNVTIKNEDVTIGSTSGAGSKDLTFTDSADNALAKITANKVSNGSSSIAFRVDTTDSNDENINTQFQFFIAKSGVKVINPTLDNDISLGRTSNRWKDTCTCLINGLEPSALSMPDLANGIDISSYITTGDTDNNYTPSVNGWIWIRLIGNGASIIQGDFGINSSYVTNNLTSEKWVETNLFVTKNVQSIIRCRGITGIVSAYFYPCLGNV